MSTARCDVPNSPTPIPQRGERGGQNGVWRVLSPMSFDANSFSDRNTELCAKSRLLRRM